MIGGSAWAVHPFLFATLPIVYLYARNLAEVPGREVVVPILLSLLGCAGLLWGSVAAIGDPARGAIVATLFLALFFTFSRYDIRLARAGIVKSASARRWIVLAAMAALFALLAAVALALPARGVRIVTAALNVAAILAAGLLGLEVALGLRKERARPLPRPEPFPVDRPQSDPPDIYYIILDGYARGDGLRDLFALDNPPFLDALRQRGFTVSDAATSNYAQTPLSLASSLNGRHLHDLASDVSRSSRPLIPMIRRGSVAATLAGLGYRIEAFASGFSPTEMLGADRYLARRRRLSDFHAFVLGTTPLAFLLSPLTGGDPYRKHRERVMYTLERLPDAARDPSPKFVFAHILAPHPPFVFDEAGGDVSPRETPYFLCDGNDFAAHYGDDGRYVRGYSDQVRFLNDRVLTAIDGILAHSERPPVILLQSDHGAGSRLDYHDLDATDMTERMGILHALHLPERAAFAPYPGISPVNSFRVIFNACFGASLPLLEDRAYFSTTDQPFRFIDVTDRVAAPRPSFGERRGDRPESEEVGLSL